jgi:ribosomal protein S21
MLIHSADRPQCIENGKKRVQVLVRDNNVDQALKALKKKMQREGIFREMKLRGHFEKPSEKRRVKRLKLFVAHASWLASGHSVKVFFRASPLAADPA